ncbi:unnamed protein product [Paramecium sonneborni]|uniref:Uncharacterized protein n=1 Tax=Paramecium sonneborni TaxID=65129 RepID=A0A8S1PL03_9CILI|nr:unnamed protein product [Paramecium sonneborni]
MLTDFDDESKKQLKSLQIQIFSRACIFIFLQQFQYMIKRESPKQQLVKYCISQQFPSLRIKQIEVGQYKNGDDTTVEIFLPSKKIMLKL